MRLTDRNKGLARLGFVGPCDIIFTIRLGVVNAKFET